MLARLPASRLVPLLLVALLASAARVGSQSPPTYRAEFLGAGSHVAAMNEAGTVVWRGTAGVVPRAYVGGPGQKGTLLLMPFGLLSSDAADINEAGAIVGNVSPYTTTGLKAYPGLWQPDGTGGYLQATVPALLPGDDRGTGDALNDAGDVLGTSSYTSTTRTVRFTPGGTVELPGLGALPAVAVNDQRVYLSGNKLVHLDTLQVETLPVPPGYAAAVGWCLDDAGHVGGELTVAGCGDVVAMFAPGLGWQTFGACGAGNRCFDVNVHGDVLMKLGGVPYVHLAGQGTWRVEDLIAEDAGHWTVTSPFGIAMNGQRQIALVASNATTGEAGVVLLTPDATCQADLGQGGPGPLHLSMCGGDLSTGTTATLSLAGGVSGGGAVLFAGLVQGGAPFKGGTLVPVPWLLQFAVPLDASGAATFPGVPGGGGPLSVYVQAAAADGAQPAGVALSNALRVDLLP